MKIGFLEDSWLEFVLLGKFLNELEIAEITGYGKIEEFVCSEDRANKLDYLFISYKNNRDYQVLLESIVRSSTKIFLCYDKDKFDYTLPSSLADKCYVLIKPYNMNKLQRAISI